MQIPCLNLTALTSQKSTKRGVQLSRLSQQIDLLTEQVAVLAAKQAIATKAASQVAESNDTANASVDSSEPLEVKKPAPRRRSTTRKTSTNGTSSTAKKTTARRAPAKSSVKKPATAPKSQDSAED